jgi:hypothetical protein
LLKRCEFGEHEAKLSRRAVGEQPETILKERLREYAAEEHHVCVCDRGKRIGIC